MFLLLLAPFLVSFSFAILDKVFYPPIVEKVTGPIEIDCAIPVCEGPLAQIYCNGTILSTAYLLGLNGVCPGRKLSLHPELILANFNKLKYPIDRESFMTFCADNFEINDNFLYEVIPPDWHLTPVLLKSINDRNHMQLAAYINGMWPKLTRKYDSDVLSNPHKYPVIPVKHPFVVPGGFFEVYFYWDTYWINKGLLLSDMAVTVKGMIQNFAELVDTLGYIPNGGYIYLQGRSQPPLFVQMIDDYYTYTKDIKSVEEWMPSMDKEMQFWINQRSIQHGDIKGMFVYQTNSDCPRPENFLSDYKLGMKSKNARATWRAIASACESGWDFSSRWMEHSGEEAYKKYTLQTDQIVPVDLNVFMVRNFRIMANFKALLNDEKLSTYYQKMADRLEADIHHFMWNHTAGVWFDLRRNILTHRSEFYPSNVYPLLLGNDSNYVITKVKNYLKHSEIFDFPGGIPSSLPVKSKEQWDFPNVWAPNQHLFILSLWNTGDKELIEEANKQARKFVDVAYRGLFEPPSGQKGGLWEKYNATRSDGTAGGGGEYPVQIGFGWTNGALLDLMFRLATPKRISGRSLETTGLPNKPFAGGSPHIYIIAGLLTFLVSLAIAYSLCGISNNSPSQYSHLPDDEEEDHSLLEATE